MHSPARSFRRSPVGIGLAIFATITLILSLAAVVRPNPAFAQDEGGQGTAQCPTGTTFLANIEVNGEGNIDGSFDGLTFELVNDGKGLEVTNTTEDQTFTIVVKGGSDNNDGGDGDAVEVGPGETVTVTAPINDSNGTPFGVSNFSICGTEDGGEEEGEDLVLIKQDLEAGSLSGVGFTLGDGDEILTVDGQITFSDLTEGSFTLTETSNPDENCETGGTLTVDVTADGMITVTDDDEADGLAIVSFDATTNVLVLSNDCEEPGEELVEVEIMKHLCADVSTVAEFEAIEAEAREEAGSTGLEENEDFAALAATVVNCPTIILSADVPMDESPDAQVGEFDFTVLDANGEQILSSDGLFVDDKLCETDIMVDVDNSGSFDADVCLDTSYYRFEVSDGIVTITETDAPGDESFFGTIRFTPGSGDEMALVGSIDEVEASGGVITLDTTLDPDNSGEGTPDEYADDLIMVHVYNFTPDGGEEPGEGGAVEVDKLFCSSDEGSRTEIDVSDPIMPSFSAQSEGQAPEDGCVGGEASFTIFAADENGEPTGDPVATGITDEGGELTIDLEAGTYVIVEDETGASATFTIEDGALTIVLVTNFESGLVKVIKLFCDGDEDAVLFSIDGSEATGFDPDTCESGDAVFQIDDGDEFTTVDGEALVFAGIGTSTLTELAPNEGTSAEFEVEFAAEGEFEPVTTVIVYDVEGEDGGEGPGEEEMVEVMVMKHLCTEVSTTAEFEAIEAAARDDQPDPALKDFAALAATVANCPTVVEDAGDVQTDSDVVGGQADFDFAVADTSQVQTLSADGMFEAEQLCAADIGLDGQFGDICLDISHYSFSVVDGNVLVLETEEPDGTSFGTIRLTPGSGDEDAVLSDRNDQLIRLDTTLDPDNGDMPEEYGSDVIMLHVYDFQEEDEGGVNPGSGGNGPTGEGTLGGNPAGAGGLPNTATSPVTESLPAALLALLVIAGLGWTARVNLAAVRARLR